MNKDLNLSYTRLKRSNLKCSCGKCGGRLAGVRSGEYRCMKCGATEYDDFGKIRNYLNEHGPASKEEIGMATGVEREIINEYIREQRLEAARSPVNMKCVICGKKISSGTLCEDCAGTRKKGVTVGKVEAGKMRTDHHRNRGK